MDDLVPHGARWRTLGGFSGALVLLVEDRDGRRYVRKVVGDPAHNGALKAQIDRQELIVQVLPDPLRIPAIIATGYVHSRYFIDMQLIDGLDGVTFLRTASLNDVRRFTDALVEYIGTAESRRSPVPVNPDSFEQGVANKIADLRCKLETDSEALEVLEEIERQTARVVYPGATTLCHGDLTLENLLVDRDGTIWFIDLLPPPFEHVWFDLAKLEQDLAGGWYLRSHDQLDAGVRTFLLGAVRSATSVGSYETARVSLLALTFARILPYAKERSDRDFVMKRIRSTLADGLRMRRSR
jgi:aminoglycoside phosphotransferase